MTYDRLCAPLCTLWPIFRSQSQHDNAAQQLLDTAWMAHAGADDCARLRIARVSSPPPGGVLHFASGSSCAVHRSVRIYVRGAVCGDGVLDLAAGEVCDDGNTASGDGCSADCATIEEVTCASILAASPATPSGPQVALRHRGATSTHVGWCDMTTDGGAWQLASKFSSAPGGSGLNATAQAAAALPWTHGTAAVTAAPQSPEHEPWDSVASHDWRAMLLQGSAAEMRVRCETSAAGANAVDMSYRFAVPGAPSSSSPLTSAARAAGPSFVQPSPLVSWELSRRRLSARAIPLSRRRVYENAPGVDLGDALYGEDDAALHPAHAWDGAGHRAVRRRETMRMWLPYTSAVAAGASDTRVTPCSSDSAVLNTASPETTWCLG
jgi:cysteine-rich repeat protein